MNCLLFVVWDLLFICNFFPSSDFYNFLPRVQYYLWDTIRDLRALLVAESILTCEKMGKELLSLIPIEEI